MILLYCFPNKSHGINAMMNESLSDYRDRVAMALAGRSMAGIATTNGLPRDAIRYVIQGHDPKLSRADAICRALDFSFTIGPSLRHQISIQHPSCFIGDRSPVYKVPVSDAELTLLLTRLCDLWPIIDTRERKSLAIVIADILELTEMMRSTSVRQSRQKSCIAVQLRQRKS